MLKFSQKFAHVNFFDYKKSNVKIMLKFWRAGIFFVYRACGRAGVRVGAGAGPSGRTYGRPTPLCLIKRDPTAFNNPEETPLCLIK